MTTADEEWIPPGVDPSKPSIARVYDFMLGGKDNFAIDRQVAQLGFHLFPDAFQSSRANRDFIGRSVRHQITEGGITQFLDLGSGLPTQGNIHEIAHELNPSAKVVYVDNDPMVIAHGRALLAGDGTTTVLQADVREPEAILTHPDVLDMIDFSQPVGVLLSGILHHVNDDRDPAGIAARLRSAVPPGSFMTISHFHNPMDRHPEAAKRAAEVERMSQDAMETGRWRTYEEILAYFGDWELLEPGLVPLPDWRPSPTTKYDIQPETYHTMICGVARRNQ